jgi:hypothetical protein
MRRLIILTGLAFGLALPSIAQARGWAYAAAFYVQHQLVHHWRTSDGQRVISARCDPRRNAPGGHYANDEGEALDSAWSCSEVDVLDRILYVHVRVQAGPPPDLNPYISSVTEFRCSDRHSRYRCPA